MIDVFISHASEDKAEFVRPLADALKERGLSVWYDDFVLKLGDNIQARIDDGLVQARFGVVVLSPAFFAKQWTQRELGALVSEEISRRDKLLLPIWHGVGRAEIAKYSPLLADRVGVSTLDGLEVVVNAILGVVNPNAADDEGQSRLEAYQVLYPVHYGHYGIVLKCRSRETGALCVLKKTKNQYVSFDTQRALSSLNVPNLAVPRNVWRTSTTTYEELPYVGGNRLTDVVLPGIGGLSGSVLESFHTQMMTTLGELHAAGIAHRDVHPDNIYMVVERGRANSTESQSPWRFDEFGIDPSDMRMFVNRSPRLAKRFGMMPLFRIAWVLVDTSFATFAGSDDAVPFRHGSFTSLEQLTGGAATASDMYALGATLYYGVSGRMIAPYQDRRRNPKLPSDSRKGRHPSIGFQRQLERLLALDPADRPLAPDFLSPDTHTAGYCGTLLAPSGELLLCDAFSTWTSLTRVQEALAFLREKVSSASPAKTAEEAEALQQLRAVIERLETIF